MPKQIPIALSIILCVATSFAGEVIGIGSFEAGEVIGDPQLRGEIASVYYGGPGVYGVSFTSELTGSVDDYVVIPTGWKSQETRVCDVDRQSKTLYGFTITCKDGDGNAADPKNVQFAVFQILPE